MTLEEFIDYVNRILEDDTGYTWKPEQVKAHMRFGIRDFYERSRMLSERVSFATEPGVSDYVLPPETLEVSNVCLDGVLIERGKTYHLSNNTISLDPLDSEHVLTYLRTYCPEPPSLPDDVMPPRYENAIAHYTVARCFEQLEQWEKAQWHLQRYAEEIDKARVSGHFESQEGIDETVRNVVW